MSAILEMVGISAFFTFFKYCNLMYLFVRINCTKTSYQTYKTDILS